MQAGFVAICRRDGTLEYIARCEPYQPRRRTIDLPGRVPTDLTKSPGKLLLLRGSKWDVLEIERFIYRIRFIVKTSVG